METHDPFHSSYIKCKITDLLRQRHTKDSRCQYLNSKSTDIASLIISTIWINWCRWNAVKNTTKKIQELFRRLWKRERWLLLAEKLAALTAAERQELQQPRGGEEPPQPISVPGGRYADRIRPGRRCS